MKNILMIGTGGTIASEMTPSGLTPELNSTQLLSFVPRIGEMCHVDCVQLYSLDSTNIRPAHWLGVAKAVRENYARYDGFVISHGTDTMAYTAAALSYLIQGSPKPIVLTGAQKPIWFDGTDSKRNLTDAFLYACRGCGGVQIVFNGKVILGTRARKTCSKSFQAFSSINYPVLGVVQEGRLLPYLCPRAETQLAFYHDLETNVSLVKLIPGLSPDYLAFALEHSRGVLIESFGVGGVPDGEAGGYYDLIRQAEAQGKTVVLTTQVQNEGSDLGIYQVGHSLKADLGVMETYDMTLEMAVAKLMWALAQTKDPAEVTRYFYTPVANDILRVPGESL